MYLKPVNPVSEFNNMLKEREKSSPEQCKNVENRIRNKEVMTF